MGLGLRPRSPTRPPSGPHGSPRGPTGLPRAKNPAGGFRKYDPPAGSLRVPGGRVVNTHWLRNGIRVPYSATPKYLGLTLDPSLTMEAHTTAVITRVQKRLGLMKMLSGTTWGANTHTLRTTYLTYVLPLIRYALGIYGPQLSTHLMDKLEAEHNAAARIITGCPLPTSRAKLLWEARLTPIVDLMRLDAVTAFELFRRHTDTPGKAACGYTSASLTLNNWLSAAQRLSSEAHKHGSERGCHVWR